MPERAKSPETTVPPILASEVFDAAKGSEVLQEHYSKFEIVGTNGSEEFLAFLIRHISGEGETKEAQFASRLEIKRYEEALKNRSSG